MSRQVFVGSSFSEEAERVLARGLAGYRVTRPEVPQAGNLTAHGDDAPIDAEVVFGQPTPRAIAASPRVRWVHLTSAGYTRYAEPCATHAIALVLALLRRLDEAGDEQRGARRWPAAALRAKSAVLADKRVLVLGYGAIGRRLCELLAVFGADVAAVRERARGDEPVRVVTTDALDLDLARADIVISTLPESASTRGFLDRARIGRMSPGALFVNVGRGTTVDQGALVEALADGRLGGAGLDVTDPEPLPADHPLWSMPRCIVTPHTAGGRADEPVRIVRHFLENLERYERGAALVDRV